jgi:hypothetical protein
LRPTGLTSPRRKVLATMLIDTAKQCARDLVPGRLDPSSRLEFCAGLAKAIDGEVRLQRGNLGAKELAKVREQGRTFRGSNPSVTSADIGRLAELCAMLGRDARLYVNWIRNELPLETGQAVRSPAT